MEENRNQVSQGGSLASGGILVKDVDGRFKMASDGVLKDLDAFLSEAQTASPVKPAPEEERAGLGFPKFTDLAITPQDAHFKEPARDESADASQLHFHPEDRRELERELQKINTLFSLAPQKKYSIEKISQKLEEKHALHLNERESRTLAMLLLSYFRQARNAIQVKNELVRPKTEGALGLQPETADHVLAIAKHLKLKIDETDGIVVEEGGGLPVEGRPQEQIPRMPTLPSESVVIKPPQRPSPAPEVRQEPKPATPAVTAKPPETSPVAGVARTSEPESPKPFFVDEIQPSAAPEAAMPQPLPQAPQPIVAPQPSAIPRVSRPRVPQRAPLMAEVRRIEPKLPASALTGRVEELALMDLATWRLLDTDPRIRAGKILGKIQNLEHESLTRKSQGIQAWRSNEVYQYYLMLGEQSLHQRKNVADIIKDLESRGTSTLSLEEFEAITDLNRTLRF